MSPRTRYIVTETAINVSINGMLSVGFVYLAFRGQTNIAARSLALDMAPQTFMVVLMSCLVPALLTRKRLSGGGLPWHEGAREASWKLIGGRAVLSAALCACALLTLCWALLPLLAPQGFLFTPILVCKTLFGVLLAALATPWAIRKVLR